MAKMSPMLSKLLNDITIPSDEAIVEINNGITEDATELSENNEVASELLNGIEETTEAIELVETVGLQSGAKDLVSAKLLANRLSNAVRKLDSSFKLEVAGLQSDADSETFLKDSLEEAKGILAIAKDELAKAVKNISEKVISLDTKIEDMKKWVLSKEEIVNAEADKKTETIEAIAELIAEVKETTTDVAESEAVDVEVPAEATAAMDNTAENLEEIKEEVASTNNEQKEETPPASEDDKKDDTEDELDNVNKDDKE